MPPDDYISPTITEFESEVVVKMVDHLHNAMLDAEENSEAEKWALAFWQEWAV